MKRHGFTLIELLIVVAIIGILAAIAVPNFLNAQTRAKIARCKSDLRSLGMAMEQYSLDLSYYPPSHQLYRLTTPVSYIAAIPADVFPPISKVANSGQPEANLAWTWYRYFSTPKGVSDKGSTTCHDYWAYFPPFLERSAAVAKSNQEGCPARAYIKSFGPNAGTQGLWTGGTNGDDFTLRYDPSNGLVSFGDIAMFVPGVRVE